MKLKINDFFYKPGISECIELGKVIKHDTELVLDLPESKEKYYHLTHLVTNEPEIDRYDWSYSDYWYISYFEDAIKISSKAYIKIKKLIGAT